MPAKAKKPRKRVVRRKKGRKGGGPILDSIGQSLKNVGKQALQAGIKEAKVHMAKLEKALQQKTAPKKAPAKKTVTAGALRKKRKPKRKAAVKRKRKGGAAMKPKKRKKKGMSTLAKIGIGIGAGAAAGYGAYKVGKAAKGVGRMKSYLKGDAAWKKHRNIALYKQGR
jgi:hypothetical protein